MGEVYRARDSRLNRDVAIKLLPASVAADPERLARFTREAQVLATLNHPNIGAIYGVEESANGAALVLELVEGPTLAERIAQGPIAPDEAMAIGRQIADALEAAHEQGIVHRDLKPANVKVRADGTVKVLDFGLAKTVAGSSSITPSDIALSPTFTAHATVAGMILGTAAYMAPEQARGRAVDRRADIWAFGIVLFEMLAGSRPFGGETASEILAAIIKDPPLWSRLPAHIPGPLLALIKRTLEKDPKQRLRDIGDARIALQDLQSGGEASLPAAAPISSPAWRPIVPWVVALAGVTLAIVAATRPRATPAAEVSLVKFTLPITGESLDRTALPSISPDGRHVVFAKGGDLWIRSFDELEARQLAGTTGAQHPFWSPDSKQVAYLAATALWRVAVDGSRPIQIATYHFNKGGRTPGGVWRSDDTILFAPSSTGSTLLAVTTQGGEFREFVPRDTKVEGDFHRPSLLPDGLSVLFVVDRIDGGPDTIGVLVDGRRKNILTIPGEVLDSPVYSPTGHILYHRETTTPGVWAVPFALETLTATGTPFLVAAQASYPSISKTGTLVYADNSVSGASTLAWLDIETGAVSPATSEQFPAIGSPHLSPDEQKVAAVVPSPGEGLGVVIADLRRGTHVRLPGQATLMTRVAWRDDETVVFSRADGPGNAIVMRPANGSGSETVLVKGRTPSVAHGSVFFSKESPGTSGDLYRISIPGQGTVATAAELVQQLPVEELDPVLSPDGTLLAYAGGDLGQSEIVLRTYPEQKGQWQVSAGGGSLPVWSRLGDAIYYKNTPGDILRVDVRSNPVTLGVPRHIARPASLRARVGYDISADGRRLLMVQEVKTDEQHSASVAVVQNWSAAFKK